jgi:sterol desaturase/sphingolipid hydroxylase (fatty acid hydroxylase superfamily)
MNELANMQIIAAAIVMASLWTLEAIFPFLPNRPGRFGRNARNIAIGMINSVILALLYAPVVVGLTAWTRANEFALLNLFSLSVWTSAILAFLLQDAWMYLWHRLNHRIPFLWRFHKVHHSDPFMNASTAVRFHTGEILISAILRLGVIALTGLSLWQVLLYDLVMIPVIFFHHSDLRFPEKADKIYRALFASPAMHRIHHSPVRVETDSNYGTIFSFWDRLGRSFRLRASNGEVKYGLDELTGTATERLSAIALMPFQNSAARLKNKLNGHKVHFCHSSPGQFHLSQNRRVIRQSKTRHGLENARKPLPDSKNTSN